MTIIEMMGRFNTNEKCLTFLKEIRWKNGIICPYCGSTKASHKAEKHQNDIELSIEH